MLNRWGENVYIDIVLMPFSTFMMSIQELLRYVDSLKMSYHQLLRLIVNMFRVH